MIAFSGCILLAGERSLQQQFIDCYSSEPKPSELLKRLVAFSLQAQGTDVEDDVSLALAHAYAINGDVPKAIAILQKLKGDKQAVKLDTNFMWVGGMTPKDGRIYGNMAKRFSRSPDFTSDHALLEMAELSIGQQDRKKALQALEELRGKYPEGDRVVEDMRNIDQVRASMDKSLDPYLYHEPRTDNLVVVPMVKQVFLAYRRPHLKALQQEVSLCTEDSQTIHYVGLLVNLVETYGQLLMWDERWEYANGGLKAIDGLPKDLPEQDRLAADKAKQLFQTTLQKLEEEKKKAEGGQ